MKKMRLKLHKGVKTMTKQLNLIVMALVISGASYAAVQSQRHTPSDQFAAQLVEKYARSSCEELAASLGEKEFAELRSVDELHNDTTARRRFVNRVAAPIVNKLFECGLIS